MSVGYARRRGQEGRPVLFPQQGPHFIRVVRQTQVCLERALNLTEKKKGVQQQTTHSESYMVCLSICQHLGASSVVFIF